MDVYILMREQEVNDLAHIEDSIRNGAFMDIAHNPDNPFCCCFACLEDFAVAGLLPVERIPLVDADGHRMEAVHTDERPRCDDMTCPCNNDGWQIIGE